MQMPIALASLIAVLSTAETSRLNVLFIIVDDLAPTLGCYEQDSSRKYFHTPNIDSLADRGFLFENAFAQQALCGPSRTSLLTCRRPDSLCTYDNDHAYWRQFVGNFTTLPQNLRENGFYTASGGKVFHPGRLSGNTDDYPESWSERPFHPSSDKFKNAKVCPDNGELRRNLVCPVNVSEQPERTLPDIETLAFAQQFLADVTLGNRRQQPFFLAVGFQKPHIPIKFPEEFLAYYELDSVPLAPNRVVPPDLPAVAWNPWQDLREREDVAALNLSFPYAAIPDHFQRRIRQSYFAAVTYVDALIGELLETLERTGLERSTIVVLTSDHGWQLGEHGEWAKYSNYGVATRVPLIIRHPSLARNRRIRAFVELVDLFPSIIELVSLPSILLCPPRARNDHMDDHLCCEGVSFVPLLSDAEFAKNSSRRWKRAVFTQYPRPSLLPRTDSDEPKFRDIRVMGYAMRDHRYHVVEWRVFALAVGERGAVVAMELYDLRGDSGENRNVAGKARYRGRLRRLRRRLRRGWRSALPEVELD